jgi:23S rRNA pseudouridine955/2504/2580 synthase
MSKTEYSIKNIELIMDHKDFIVINKPYGLACQGGNKVSQSIDEIFLKKNGADFDYKLVHRLDMHTSGALILAKYKNAAQKLCKLFEDHKIIKNYLAIVLGNPYPENGIIDAALIKTSKLGKEMICISSSQKRDFKNYKQALTKYKTTDLLYKHLAVVNITPITGRKHQIRAHFNYIGNPIIGDGKYGGKRAFLDKASNKLHLHCHKLEFNFKGKLISVKASLPNHMKETARNYDLNL